MWSHLVAIGRPKGHRGSYKQWEEGGVPPTLVVEVMSPSNTLSEMLAKHHGFKVSRETVRKWMQEDGIWLSRKQRRTFHQPRLRRECFGELIQIDGSDHRWFEDRGDPCTLLVFIDDATSTLMELRFVKSEST